MTFLALTPEREQAFRQWARGTYTGPKIDIHNVWHPVVRDECAKINAERKRVF